MRLWSPVLCACLFLVFSEIRLLAGDQPQWGQAFTRNMISDEIDLPERFDPESGENVKWIAELGTANYSTPVVAGGKVFIGTNNNRPRDAKHQGDRGVFFCLNAADGSLDWQLVVPKLDWDRYLDWPGAGMCSTAAVEDDRVYTVTNRDEVVCLDINGMADGNDGPYKDEASHMTPAEDPALELGPLDADILWLLDLRDVCGVRPHDSAHAGILIDGPFLYLNTSNGLTSRHDGVDKPEAPSLITVEKSTGRLLAREREGMSRKIFHCTWSSPALGEIDGQRRVYFCGGDGVLYSLAAYKPGDLASLGPDADGRVPSMRLISRFDCDPDAPKENVHSYIRNRRVSPSNIKSMPVVVNDRVYVTHGGDIWWGKNESWLKCIDAGGTGDVTDKNLLWSLPLGDHCCSTVAVQDGLVYVADCNGNVYCVDDGTGKTVWQHDAGSAIWASTLVADGKVYVGTRRGTFWVLAAGREKRVLSSVELDTAVISTAAAADGVLYVGTMEKMYALQK